MLPRRNRVIRPGSKEQESVWFTVYRPEEAYTLSAGLSDSFARPLKPLQAPAACQINASVLHSLVHTTEAPVAPVSNTSSHCVFSEVRFAYHETDIADLWAAGQLHHSLP